MKKRLSYLFILSVSADCSAENFLQIYQLKADSFDIVECESKQGANSCRLRTFGLLDSCVLTSVITEFGPQEVTPSNDYLTWEITELKKDEHCDSKSTYVATGPNLTIQVDFSGPDKKLCESMFPFFKITIPRLPIGLNPTLPTYNCKNITVLY
jgi:hypothetical protein